MIYSSGNQTWERNRLKSFPEAMGQPRQPWAKTGRAHGHSRKQTTVRCASPWTAETVPWAALGHTSRVAAPCSWPPPCWNVKQMHPNAEWPDATFSRGVWNVGSATCQSPRSVFGALVDKHHLSQRPSLTAASPRTQVWGPFFHVTSESQSWPGIPVCQLLAWFLTPRLPVRQHQV